MKCRVKDRHPEAGSAVVEFIAMTCALVVPAVYLVVALADVQGAVFAVDAASREAARVLGGDVHATQAATAAVQSAATPHGVAGPVLDWSCRPEGCPPGRSTVVATVSADVDLPLVPDALRLPGIRVSATAEHPTQGVALVH